MVEEVEDNIEEQEETGTEVEETEEGEAAEETEGEEESEDSSEEEPKGKSAGEVAEEGAKGRAASRLQRLANENRELREAKIRAETQAEERARAQQAPQGLSAEEQRRIRDEKLALMDPTERRDFLRDEELNNMKQQILLTQLQTQDQLDKNAYAAKAASNSVYAKHAAEVEKRLREERQAGRNWSRDTILAQVVGEKALSAKPDTKKKEQAKERVESAKAKAPSGRSNTSGYRPGRAGESLEDLESRLENVSF